MNTPDKCDTKWATKVNRGKSATLDKSSTPQEMDDTIFDDFSHADDMSDLALVVDGKSFHTCASLLAMASPVFKERLGKLDTKQNKKKTVPLTGKNYDAVKTMLQWLTPSVHRAITGDTAELVLPLADEFKIARLKQDCEQHILNNFRRSVNCDKCVHYLLISTAHNLNQLQEAVAEHFSKLRLEDLQALPGISDVTVEMLLRIAHKRIRLLECHDKNPVENAGHSSILRFSDFRHNTREPFSLSPQNMTSPEGDEESDDVTEDGDSLTLLVEDKELRTSDVLMAASSPVLKAMISSPFRESRSKAVMLPGKTFASVKFMVDFVESPDPLELNDDLVWPVLALANEYQMGKMKITCEQHLLRMLQKIKRPFYTTEYTSFLRFFKSAQECHLKEVVRYLTPILSKVPVKDLERCKNYEPVILQPVYLARVKFLESEGSKSGTKR